ncbi:hypothetical protein QE152_g24317 [Popillia japonica]|uniref:Uncharacterized protein n=1 Tax=Popillia japonica TaxID=7064 RepID=A0AAW1KGX7_POPJA
MRSRVTQNEPQTVNIGKPRRGRSTQFKDLELPCLCPNEKCLSNQKVANLNELIQIVSEDAKYFYNFLMNVRTKNFQDNVNEFGDAINFEAEETFEYNGNEENYADTVVGERSTEHDV